MDNDGNKAQSFVDSVLTYLITMFSLLMFNALIVKWCWNYVMVRIFLDIPELTYGMSLVLTLMCNVLFKSHSSSSSSKESS